MPAVRALLSAFLCAIALLAAGCGGDEPAAPPGQTEEAEEVEPAPSPEDTGDEPAEGGEEQEE